MQGKVCAITGADLGVGKVAAVGLSKIRVTSPEL
jgi:NAD(P)-dependent dehydrogenase (short-subunit alcohol dehydrogenase family)